MNTEKKNWKLVNFCEFDPYAVKSYCAIHNIDESLNLGDITKVDETNLAPFTMIVGGSPCQDFSVAGKQKGSVWTCNKCGAEYNPLTVHFSKRDKCPHCGSTNLDKSRSSLLVEWLRIIRANKPNFGIYENVKNIVGKQFKETTFKLFTNELEEYGYNVYWKVLNAKDYGIPQNRERVFVVIIKKYIDNDTFKFPEGFPLELRLKDILEESVDEKFYLSEKALQGVKNSIYERKQHVIHEKDWCDTLLSRDYKDPKCVNDTEPVRIGGLYDNEKTKHQAGSIWDKNAIAPTIDTMGGGNRQPLVVDEAKVNVIGNVNPSGKGQNGQVVDSEGLARTITQEKGEGQKILVRDEIIKVGNVYPLGGQNGSLKIRKLTPKECFRLMGFDDVASEKAAQVNSNTQLYKQAGNSIVVDVLYYILIELYKAMPCLFDDLKLGSYFSGIGAFEIALNRLYDGINKGNFIKPQSI